MILILDNYDSFTYNLYQMFACYHADIQVIRNDQTTPEAIKKLKPDGIILSPGPGYPDKAGIMLDLIKEMCGQSPILGVCLGHQALAEAFGAAIVEAPEPVHGKVSNIKKSRPSRLLEHIDDSFSVGRYHSLIVDQATLPDCFQVTATGDGGMIMAMEHKVFPCFGLQFHPESILTPCGEQILQNFLQIASISAK